MQWRQNRRNRFRLQVNKSVLSFRKIQKDLLGNLLLRPVWPHAKKQSHFIQKLLKRAKTAIQYFGLFCKKKLCHNAFKNSPFWSHCFRLTFVQRYSLVWTLKSMFSKFHFSWIVWPCSGIGCWYKSLPYGINTTQHLLWVIEPNVTLDKSTNSEYSKLIDNLLALARWMIKLNHT